MFKMLSTFASIGLAASALPAAAQEVEVALTQTYLCDGAAVLRVAYLNPPGGESYAVVDLGGRLIPMQAGPTGSGVRYVAFDVASGLVWHTKGDEGFIARDTGSDQETILDGCRSIGN